MLIPRSCRWGFLGFRLHRAELGASVSLVEDIIGGHWRIDPHPGRRI
jgi:hypothetical protein